MKLAPQARKDVAPADGVEIGDLAGTWVTDDSYANFDQQKEVDPWLSGSGSTPPRVGDRVSGQNFSRS